MRLRICHLYPDLMDLYGDRGNIITLEQRCSWRGIEVETGRFSLGQSLDFREWDILFFGGGSDREQGLLYEDLCRRRENMAAAIEDGLVVLGVCGGLQLMGKYYQTVSGERIPGVEILDLWTVAGEKRLIGNICLELGFLKDPCQPDRLNPVQTVVGFENHSGQTFLGKVQPLGRVVKGFGNNGKDNLEGVHYKNVFGTYLHGPLLPKNPHLADHLLGLALERRWGARRLELLDDSLEFSAHTYMVNKLNQ